MINWRGKEKIDPKQYEKVIVYGIGQYYESIKTEFRAVLLAGARIGRGSIVGANAVTSGR